MIRTIPCLLSIGSNSLSVWPSRILSYSLSSVGIYSLATWLNRVMSNRGQSKGGHDDGRFIPIGIYMVSGSFERNLAGKLGDPRFSADLSALLTRGYEGPRGKSTCSRRVPSRTSRKAKRSRYP